MEEERIMNEHVGGCHNVTAALSNVLAAKGVKSPHDDKPFSEHMLLGIGGGLGAGYILWEFKQHESATIVLGFRNRWNYNVDFLTNLCNRIGINPTIHETSGKKTAADYLQTVLDSGEPCLAWVDKAHLPYQHLPEALKGYNSHTVGIHGQKDGQIVVDDLAAGPFMVLPEDFAAARGRIPSDKNRLMLVDTPSRIDLKAAVSAGIQDCLEHLGRDSESFSLPVYKKWAKLITDRRNKKGWHVVFKERKGLYSTLRSIYEGIEHDSTEGYALREMYADFLEDASKILDNPALMRAAAQYHHAARAWDNLAEAALPDGVAALKQTKDLMTRRYEQYWHRDLDGVRETSADLEIMQANYDPAFPMNDEQVDSLFNNLQDKLMLVYDAEVEALETLRQAVS